jgi:hypothetical protein
MAPHKAQLIKGLPAKEYYRLYREKNRDTARSYAKEYRVKNNNIIAESKKEKYLINKDHVLTKAKEYYIKNKDYKIQYQREYHLKNPKPKVRIYYTKEQRKITTTLRNRFNNCVRRKTKYESVMSLIGCSIDFYKKYIESKFEKGMSWDNHGKNTWHIDHIIPLVFFNMENIEEQRKAFHYTNTQPLWATQNLKKGAKWQSTST